jgi:hypothetical protein
LKKIIYIFFFLAISVVSYAQNSVLSKGTWLKIGVTQSGVYKIDFNILQNAGLNPTQIDPRKIRFYGNGGKMLAQANAEKRPNDLIENAITIEGENDGRFDAQDYLLFYGQSPHTFQLENDTFIHQTNIYSDTTFYFLTVADTLGLRVKDVPSVTGKKDVTTYDDFVFYEKDIVNILTPIPDAGSGREWFGEALFGTEKTLDFDLTDLVPNSKLRFDFQSLASLTTNSEFSFSFNKKPLGKISTKAISGYRYDNKGAFSTGSFTVNSSDFIDGSNFRVGINFDRKNETSGAGYLDFLRISAKRNLKLFGNQTHFRTLESTSNNFIIGGIAQPVTVWNLTNPLRPQKQILEISNQQARFGVSLDNLQEFIVFKNDNFLTISSLQKIKPQNLHAQVTPDLVIVTSEILQSEANRLAKFRRENDKLSVLVATTQEIYNEFSSGKQDVSAIRDFMKYLYDRNPQKLKYLLLFGDASFDYKKRSKVVDETTKEIYVPVYESIESLSPLRTYSSDDYFGFLENSEGTWQEGNNYVNHTLEIGIGRLPVKSISEAKEVVDKLFDYGNPQKTLGNWRSKVTFVADDGDGNIHQSDAEDFSKQLYRQNGSFKVDKIYLDAYPQAPYPDGKNCPAAQRALLKTFRDGSLIINYNGHGSESGLTDEKIFTLPEISGLQNAERLPLMVTATCQFGRYDDPNQVSGAELMLLSPKGGAIALLTTTRPVFQSSNYLLNNAFYKAIFQKNNGRLPRLGDVMIQTKNNSFADVYNRNFALLGDPSMRLNYPENQIVISKINGKNIGISDTLKALQKVIIEGEIKNFDASKRLENFNGVLDIDVFDKEKKLNTLGYSGQKLAYQQYQNLLYKGKVAVKSGIFKVEFVVPKDINYQFGEGKILFYAQSNDQSSDANGGYNPVIGGAINNVTPDNTPPEIKAFLNDRSFKDGNETDQNPLMIIDFFDENGINLATDGLGHQSTATLNDTLQIILNPNIQLEQNSYQKGTINYPLYNLPEGKHQLKIKLWDTYNNSSEKTLDFSVAKKQTSLRNVLNYPNPVSQFTTFRFEHDRPSEDLDVEIIVFDGIGRKIKQINQIVYRANSPLDGIKWNVQEDLPNLATGNYFYFIFVNSLTSTYQAKGFGKFSSVK